MEKVFNHINEKAKNGIPYSDAILLMLAIFCTHDVLPKECRGAILGKKELAIIFSRLSVAGKIIIDLDGSVRHADIINAGHWENVLRVLLHKKINLDDKFWERVAAYV